MYIIQRTTGARGYVAMPGSKWSYTMDATKARKFKTKEEALSECCPENESVLKLSDVIRIV